MIGELTLSNFEKKKKITHLESPKSIHCAMKLVRIMAVAIEYFSNRVLYQKFHRLIG